MLERPDLPTAYPANNTAYGVLPDDRDGTWTMWTLDECIGEFSLVGERWHAHDGSSPTGDGFDSWEGAAGDVVSRWRRTPG